MGRRFRPCTVFSTTLTIRARLIVSYHLDPGPLPRVARGTRRPPRKPKRLPRRARVQSTGTTVIPVPVPAAPVTMYLRLLLRQRRPPPVMTYLSLFLRQIPPPLVICWAPVMMLLVPVMTPPQQPQPGM